MSSSMLSSAERKRALTRMRPWGNCEPLAAATKDQHGAGNARVAAHDLTQSFAL
jgi:hypothetical protein